MRRKPDHDPPWNHEAGRTERIAMRLAYLSRAAMAAVLLIIGVAPSVSDAADTVEAVTTQGFGTLTMCRNWLVYSSCTTYGKVVLPERVAVGDQISLTFGSNPKDYTFPVRSIRHQGTNCTILSEAGATAVGGEKIEVAQCRKSSAAK
jgi:hypothetical protein